MCGCVCDVYNLEGSARLHNLIQDDGLEGPET